MKCGCEYVTKCKCVVTVMYVRYISNMNWVIDDILWIGILVKWKKLVWQLWLCVLIKVKTILIVCMLGWKLVRKWREAFSFSHKCKLCGRLHPKTKWLLTVGCQTDIDNHMSTWVMGHRLMDSVHWCDLPWGSVTYFCLPVNMLFEQWGVRQTSWCLAVLLLNVYKLCHKIPKPFKSMIALDSSCQISHTLMDIYVWVGYVVWLCKHSKIWCEAMDP